MHPGARKILACLARTHADEESIESYLSAPEPSQCYFVFFTPRSGSSWLTELLATNGGYGNPSEWFSPDVIPEVAEKLKVDNIYDYIAVAKRRLADADTGVFGLELTYFQFEMIRELIDLSLHFSWDSIRVFYLSRQDIVAQAVSLYKAVTSRVFHSTDIMDGKIPSVEYNVEEISYWLEHIVQQEIGLEALFSRLGIVPIRLNYEQMMGTSVEFTLQTFSVALFGSPMEGRPVRPTLNQKLPRAEEFDWVTRFRSDREDRCLEIEESRKTRFKALGT